MTPTRSTLLLLACSLAACAPDAPTAPQEATVREAGPSAALLNLNGYTPTLLPLLPAGISDSGVIAGTLGLNVARFRNGTLTTLPRAANLPGQYRAKGISNKGAVIGHVQFGPGLFWRAANQVPYQIVSPSKGPVLPTSVNGSDVVVGSFNFPVPGTSYSTTHAFRWTPGGGFVDITPTGYQTAVALDVNDAGYVVGYGWRAGGAVRALRWAPWAGSAAEVLEERATAQAIRSNGAAIGPAGGFTVTKFWPLAGTGGYPLPGPQQSSPDDVSRHGRLVGYTYRYASVNPHRPWTHFDGATVWLPVPDAAFNDSVEGLRVNSCGTIIGTQYLTTGTQRGLLWSKPLCDVMVTAP